MWFKPFPGLKAVLQKSLREHIKMHAMEEFFGDVLVPTEEVVEMRAGRRRKSERKLLSRLRASPNGNE